MSDVDPIIRTKLDKKLASLVGKEEKKEEKARKKNAEGEESCPGWFHVQPRFNDAVKYAVKECEEQRGNYCGGETGIKVGQLDTGYTDHPEVVKLKKEDGRSYVDLPFWIRWFNPSSRRPGKDPVVEIPLLSWASHGTSSASVLIGTGTGEQEFADGKKDRTNGVFPFVDVIPYRISRSVISFTDNLAEGALQAMVDGCKIITVSHARLYRSSFLDAVIAQSYEDGIIWVAAAGTHVAKVKKIWIYPAKYPETIALAASTINDEPWEKTHAGVAVDICAPGYRIYRPYAFRKFKLFGPIKYSYSYSDGSTFATPIAAGAAALWLAHHGEEKLNQHYPRGWQRVEAFRAVLKASAKPHSDERFKELYGAGIMDVEKLLKTPLPDAGTLKHMGTSGPAPEIDAAEGKVNRITNKELAYYTGQAKVETDDKQDDELYKYVEKRLSPKAVEVIESIVEKGKQFAKSVDPDLNKNPFSEALKQHIKSFLNG